MTSGGFRIVSDPYTCLYQIVCIESYATVKHSYCSIRMFYIQRHCTFQIARQFTQQGVAPNCAMPATADRRIVCHRRAAACCRVSSNPQLPDLTQVSRRVGVRTKNKKLSCRRETARCFVSLDISLSHSRSLKVIRNVTLE